MSSTSLHSDTTATSSSKLAGQTADQKESSGSDQESSEAAELEEGGEREEGSEEGKEGEGEILEYEASPDILKVEVEKWRSSLSYAIDSQDTETAEKVCNCCTCTLYSVWVLPRLSRYMYCFLGRAKVQITLTCSHLQIITWIVLLLYPSMYTFTGI